MLYASFVAIPPGPLKQLQFLNISWDVQKMRVSVGPQEAGMRASTFFRRSSTTESILCCSTVQYHFSHSNLRKLFRKGYSNIQEQCVLVQCGIKVLLARVRYGNSTQKWQPFMSYAGHCKWVPIKTLCHIRLLWRIFSLCYNLQKYCFRCT